MIRKLSPSTYCLHPRTVAANFGGWDQGVTQVRAASADRGKAMAVFKQARAPVPLQPQRKRRVAW